MLNRDVQEIACGGFSARTEPPADPTVEHGACQAHNSTNAQSLMQFHQDAAIGKTLNKTAGLVSQNR